MVLTKEQSKHIKKQLLAQIENTQVENKQAIKKQIISLNETQLEQFLKENKIQISKSGQLQQEGQTKQSTQESQTTQCIFCSITKNQTPSLS